MRMVLSRSFAAAPAAALLAAALFTSAGCGSGDGESSQNAPASTASTASTSPAATDPPAGPWHAGVSAEIPDGSPEAGAGTVAFPGRDGSAVVINGQTIRGISAAGREITLNNTDGTVVGAPALDRQGRAEVVIAQPPLATATGAYLPPYQPYRLVWAGLGPHGGLGLQHVLAERAEYPVFASDGAGNAVVAWLEARKTDAEHPFRVRVRAALQSRSRPFGAPVTLSEEGGEPYADGNAPIGDALAVAIGSGGQVLVAGASTSESTRIAAWTGTVEGGFHAEPVPIAGEKLYGDVFTAAVTRSGRSFVAWGSQSSGEDPDSPWLVQAASIAPGATTAGPVQEIDKGAIAFPSAFPLLRADGDRALLVWSGVERSGSPVRLRVGAADGRFGPTQEIAPSGAVISLVSGPGGAAILTWAGLEDNPDPNGYSGYYASVRPAGGQQFGAAERIPIPFPDDAPVPAFDRSGRPAVAFTVPHARGVRGQDIRLLVRDKP